MALTMNWSRFAKGRIKPKRRTRKEKAMSRQKLEAALRALQTDDVTQDERENVTVDSLVRRMELARGLIKSAMKESARVDER